MIFTWVTTEILSVKFEALRHNKLCEITHITELFLNICCIINILSIMEPETSGKKYVIIIKTIIIYKKDHRHFHGKICILSLVLS